MASGSPSPKWPNLWIFAGPVLCPRGVSRARLRSPKILRIATRVSILVEQDIPHLQSVGPTVGADLGLKDFVVLSTGEKIGNPKFFTQSEKKIAKAQGPLAKKKKGAKNRTKAGKKVSRIHAKI